MHPLGRAEQTLAIGVLADLEQDLADGPLDAAGLAGRLPSRRLLGGLAAVLVVAALDRFDHLADVRLQVELAPVGRLIGRHRWLLRPNPTPCGQRSRADGIAGAVAYGHGQTTQGQLAPAPRATGRRPASTSWSSAPSTPIPEPFARALDEVAIVIDDEPSPRAAARDRPRARTRACTGSTRACPGPSTPPTGPSLPNKITLFQTALLEDFPDPAELEHEVRVTVIHELAHHLGIDD